MSLEQLSKRQREMISRAVAAVAGLIFLYWAWGCIAWGNGAWADESTQDFMSHADSFREKRAAGFMAILFVIPYLIGGGFGFLGLALLWFSVKPNRRT